MKTFDVQIITTCTLPFPLPQNTIRANVYVIKRSNMSAFYEELCCSFRHFVRRCKDSWDKIPSKKIFKNYCKFFRLNVSKCNNITTFFIHLNQIIFFKNMILLLTILLKTVSHVHHLLDDRLIARLLPTFADIWSADENCPQLYTGENSCIRNSR